MGEKTLEYAHSVWVRNLWSECSVCMDQKTQSEWVRKLLNKHAVYGSEISGLNTVYGSEISGICTQCMGQKSLV